MRPDPNDDLVVLLGVPDPAPQPDGYPAWPEIGMCMRLGGCVRGINHPGRCRLPEPGVEE